MYSWAKFPDMLIDNLLYEIPNSYAISSLLELALIVSEHSSLLMTQTQNKSSLTIVPFVITVYMIDGGIVCAQDSKVVWSEVTGTLGILSD
jgi:hypothetical protein